MQHFMLYQSTFNINRFFFCSIFLIDSFWIDIKLNNAFSQDRFTVDQQPHYIYSPREMTRWVRGIYEALHPLKDMNVTVTVEDLVRLFVHEALRFVL